MPLFPMAFVRSDLLIKNSYVSFLDVFRGMLRIEKEQKPYIPDAIPAEDLIERLKTNSIIVQGKTVMLNPYAQSCTGIPMELYEKIATRLLDSGFTVITSVCGDQVAVNGTVGVNFSIKEELALLNYCGYIIGNRSGFMDLAAFSDAHVISIDTDSYPFSDFFTLEDMWEHNHKIKTFRWVNGYEEELIEKVINHICCTLCRH